ncbi:MAG: response regulator [Chitinophagaceae bacterium]|nr:response regulator [Polaromonas sp.]
MITPTDILNARILVVDDQALNIAVLTQLLESAGHTQITATQDPLAVGDLHHQHNYDLILLDLQMPVMDGFEVMQALKIIATDDYLPVIVITAQPDHKVRALAAGAKDFVSKPFNLVELTTRIHNMLEVRLLYKKLALANQHLAQVVQERTAQLKDSEARYRRLTELAADWYWEQDEAGVFTRVSGPVLDMLGLHEQDLTEHGNQHSPPLVQGGWNTEQRAMLQAKIAARQPFIDFYVDRIHPDGSTQQFRVSGEPMFTQDCCFKGYRGVGVETKAVP